MDRHIQSWQQTSDQRHIFLSCYRMMTANMLEAVEANSFQDKVWVSKLLHHFADYYFDALACFDCGETAPPVWQQVHQYTAEGKLHILQALLMGVNAHINYDLVLTLYDMLEPEWATLTEAQRKIRYEDHCLVNQVIADTIDAVQDEIIEKEDRFMALIDSVFGQLDEYLLSRLISSWRQDVWERAQEMLAAGSEVERESLRLEVEKKVKRTGKILGV
jgi:hypothetical protein